MGELEKLFGMLSIYKATSSSLLFSLSSQMFTSHLGKAETGQHTEGHMFTSPQTAGSPNLQAPNLRIIQERT